ncbi:unnamed protein product [Mytilus edulis]|uniref:Uncharacterized protein n=1 Tax=Mytilus edulis TaxID=6550 RepID=A0A8S3TN59_MYTED|nr:unnamed protein product [Mytilus edulis]
MEQNIKELQHTIEKEAEKRVEDQTYHAETKTKNTKLHVESAEEDNHTQTERISEKKNSEKNEPDRSNNNIKSYAGVRNPTLRKENSHHRDTYDLLIIGSSIIKDIDGKRLYKNRKVKVITLHDKTVFGAIQYIKSFRDKAKHIMFQIGSNDIEQKTPDEVIEEIEELVRVTQRYNPDATITFDGIHIKGHGIPIMVMSIKRVLNTLLNVKLWENNEYNTKTNPVRNNGIPNYQMPNSITNRKQRDHQAFEQKSHFNNPIHVGSESAINGRNKIVNMMELMLQEMRTEINRNNQDTSVNTVGTKLLDLCLSSRLRLLNGRFLGDSLGYYTYMSSSGFSTVDYAVVSESLLSSVKYFKTNDFTYLSDHVQITLYMKCSINIDKEIGLEEKGWHWIKSYKWTENSKLKLIDALLTENVKNEIIEFEMVNSEENQVGVDEATEKLTKILDNISSLSCKTTPKKGGRRKEI